MQQAKLYIGIALLILLVIFTAQNSEDVTIVVYFWQITTSLAYMIFIILAIGVIVGVIASTFLSSRKEEK